MRVAKSEEEITAFGEGTGSTNCAITAFRQGRPVILCSPDEAKGAADKIIKMLEDE